MDEAAEFRIEFSIQRKRPGDDDFEEIGFGSSGAWADLDMCTHMLDSDVSHGIWETSDGMPDPDEIMAAGRGDDA